MSHISHSNIRIDNFQFMRNDLTQYCFFLSHCHADHIMGLNSSWNYGKIYASQISKVLICDKFPHLKDFVVSKHFQSPNFIFSFRSLLRWTRNTGFILTSPKKKESRLFLWMLATVQALSCSCSKERWEPSSILATLDTIHQC